MKLKFLISAICCILIFFNTHAQLVAIKEEKRQTEQPVASSLSPAAKDEELEKKAAAAFSESSG